MSEFIEAGCPKCKTALRFKRSDSSIVAVKCPSCAHFFEVRVKSQKPDSGTLVKATAVETPMQAVEVGADPFWDARVPPPQPVISGPLAGPASGAPILPSRLARRPAPAKNWLLPAGIAAACLVGLAIGYFAFKSLGGSEMLSAMNPLGSSQPAVRNAEMLNRKLVEYVSTLESVQDEASRQAALEKLKSFEGTLESLAYDIIACEPIDGEQAETVRRTLTEASSTRADMLRLVGELNANVPANDPLRGLDMRLRQIVHAAEQHLTYSLKTLTKPERPADRFGHEGVTLKRKIVACLASMRTAADVSRSLPELQSLIDGMNSLAEKQAGTGQFMSMLPYDYEAASHASDITRTWLTDTIASKFTTRPEYDCTLQDLAYVERRFEQAMRKQHLDVLATTSMQRVGEMLYHTGGAQATSSDDRSADTASGLARSNAVRRELDRAGALHIGIGQQSPIAASADSRNSSGSSLPMDAPHRPSTAMNSSAAGQVPGSPFPMSPSSADDGAFPEGIYKGANSVRIKISGAEQLDTSAAAQRIARAIKASASDAVLSGSMATLSFRYSGSLHDVAQAIDFGDVEICDSQSRTLFVVSSGK